MTAQLFNQRGRKNDNSFTIDLPVSEDPFKRPENDRVKALRFSAFTAPDGLSGLTPPYCPFSPTFWRPEADEQDSGAVPVNRRSPLRKVLLFRSLKSAEVRSCFRTIKFSSCDSEARNQIQMLTTSTDSSDYAAHAQYASIGLSGPDIMWPRHRSKYIHKHSGRVSKGFGQRCKQTDGLVCSGLVLQNGCHK